MYQEKKKMTMLIIPFNKYAIKTSINTVSKEDPLNIHRSASNELTLVLRKMLLRQCKERNQFLGFYLT